MNFNDYGEISTAVSCLATPFHDCLQEAIEETLRKDSDILLFPSVIALAIRSRLCSLLKNADLHGWEVSFTPSQHGHFELHKNGLRLRGLKECSSGIPPAGRNPSRQDFYQPSLFDDGDKSNFILSWAWNAKYEITTTRVSHPTEPGKFGKPVHTDFCMNLMPATGNVTVGRFDTEDSANVLSFTYEENSYEGHHN